jgi:hypothetical protein
VRSFTTRYGDEVRVSAELSEPAYCFLLALNPNGEAQLCWAAGEQTPPERRQRLQFPAADEAFKLDDEPRGGLQAFVLVAAREAGFQYPVALTQAVWVRCATVPRGVSGQGERGRLWNRLWMVSCAVTRQNGGRVGHMASELVVLAHGRFTPVCRGEGRASASHGGHHTSGAGERTRTGLFSGGGGARPGSRWLAGRSSSMSGGRGSSCAGWHQAARGALPEVTWEGRRPPPPPCWLPCPRGD